MQELEPAASKTAVPVGDSDRDEQELEPAASKTATLEVPVGGNDSESDDE